MPSALAGRAFQATFNSGVVAPACLAQKALGVAPGIVEVTQNQRIQCRLPRPESIIIPLAHQILEAPYGLMGTNGRSFGGARSALCDRKRQAAVDEKHHIRPFHWPFNRPANKIQAVLRVLLA